MLGVWGSICSARSFVVGGQVMECNLKVATGELAV